jgi:hypothetical protein
VYEVDPLMRPRCGAKMQVIGFITEPRVIRRILDHQPEKRRLPRPPWPVHPARDLHSQPQAGGRGTGTKRRRPSRSRFLMRLESAPAGGRGRSAGRSSRLGLRGVENPNDAPGTATRSAAPPRGRGGRRGCAGPEHGFLDLPEAFTTGSSLMPQKKNPDALELVRGKAARLDGDLMRLLALLKGLPAGYQKDLQEDKEAVFDAADTTMGSVAVVAGVITGLSLHRDAMKAAASQEEMMAAGLAVALAREGMPFRKAHGVVGSLVAEAQASGRSLRETAAAELKALSPKVAERLDGRGRRHEPNGRKRAREEDQAGGVNETGAPGRARWRSGGRSPAGGGRRRPLPRPSPRRPRRRPSSP